MSLKFAAGHVVGARIRCYQTASEPQILCTRWRPSGLCWFHIFKTLHTGFREGLVIQCSRNGFLKEKLLPLIYCLLPPSFWAERLDPRIVGAGSLMPHLPQWPHTPPPPPRPCMHPLVGNIWVDNFFQQGYFLNSCSNKSLLPSCDNLLMLHKTRVMQKKWKYQTFPLVTFTL